MVSRLTQEEVHEVTEVFKLADSENRGRIKVNDALECLDELDYEVEDPIKMLNEAVPETVRHDSLSLTDLIEVVKTVKAREEDSLANNSLQTLSVERTQSLVALEDSYHKMKDEGCIPATLVEGEDEGNELSTAPPLTLQLTTGNSDSSSRHGQAMSARRMSGDVRDAKAPLSLERDLARANQYLCLSDLPLRRPSWSGTSLAQVSALESPASNASLSPSGSSPRGGFDHDESVKSLEISARRQLGDLRTDLGQQQPELSALPVRRRSSLTVPEECWTVEETPKSEAHEAHRRALEEAEERGRAAAEEEAERRVAELDRAWEAERAALDGVLEAEQAAAGAAMAERLALEHSQAQELERLLQEGEEGAGEAAERLRAVESLAEEERDLRMRAEARAEVGEAQVAAAVERLEEERRLRSEVFVAVQEASVRAEEEFERAEEASASARDEGERADREFARAEEASARAREEGERADRELARAEEEREKAERELTRAEEACMREGKERERSDREYARAEMASAKTREEGERAGREFARAEEALARAKEEGERADRELSQAMAAKIEREEAERALEEKEKQLAEVQREALKEREELERQALEWKNKFEAAAQEASELAQAEAKARVSNESIDYRDAGPLACMFCFGPKTAHDEGEEGFDDDDVSVTRGNTQSPGLSSQQESNGMMGDGKSKCTVM